MKKYLKSLLFFSLLIIVLSFKDNNCDCDYRCNVKTLSDLEVKKINWTPKNTTIKTLKKIIQPYPVDDKKFDKKIRFGYEFNVYQFNCRIDQIMKSDNGDYVLIMSDLRDTTNKIVGKIPNPKCDYVSKSSFVKSFNSVRNDLDELNSDNIKFSNYTVTGVYYFDEVYGIQIYPIMDIIKSWEKY